MNINNRKVCMKGNKFLDVLAGAIIGFLFGGFYYLFFTELLFCHSTPGSQLYMPHDLYMEALKLSATYGCPVGVIIGILTGLAVPITLPRGHMSKSISCTSFLICTPLAFIQHGHFLLDMSRGRIAVTIFLVFIFFLSTINFGQAFSFIERIRE